MINLNEKEQQLVKYLQESIPLVERPFALISEEIGMTEESILQKVKEWLSSGIIRRFCGVVNHQRVGKVVNAMSIWAVPPEKIEEVVSRLSARPEVSHCYERKCPNNWQYNLFAMIHGSSEYECRQVVEAIAHQTGINDYQLLFTVKEFKKTSLKII